MVNPSCASFDHQEKDWTFFVNFCFASWNSALASLWNSFRLLLLNLDENGFGCPFWCIGETPILFMLILAKGSFVIFWTSLLLFHSDDLLLHALFLLFHVCTVIHTLKSRLNQMDVELLLFSWKLLLILIHYNQLNLY